MLRERGEGAPDSSPVSATPHIRAEVPTGFDPQAREDPRPGQSESWPRLGGGSIHWESTPEGVCERRDTNADATSVTLLGGTTITNSARAMHAENVTCLVCLRAVHASDLLEWACTLEEHGMPFEAWLADAEF